MKPAKYIYVFHEGKPPVTGIYETKRQGTTNQARRYWDGKMWWSLTSGKKGSKTKVEVEDKTLRSEVGEKPYKGWREDYTVYTQKLSNQRDIMWARPRAQYSDTQLLNFAIGAGLCSREMLNNEMCDKYKQPKGM